MLYSLEHHSRGYGISASDAFFSLATGLSGVPYARRHYQMSKVDTECFFGHRALAVIEAVPFLGALVALVERVVVFVFQRFISSSWRPRYFSKDASIKKMHKNACKAIKEHRVKSTAYALAKNEFPFLKEIKNAQLNQPLGLTCFAADHIGKSRNAMEDAYFYEEMDSGAIAGVFDGHGGDAVSKYVCLEFRKRFPQTLSCLNRNVHQAFESLIHEIHREIAKRPKWKKIGSTAVICYIDAKKGLIYTANLGDSEANIYRKIGGKLKSIPLSCIRDWRSPKDAARLARAYNMPWLIKDWANHPKPKDLRSKITKGVNVARAFGDVRDKVVGRKPKITVNLLRPGDLLLLACDGLKDYFPEADLVDFLNRYNAHLSDLADNLVRRALFNMKDNNGDNITVLAIPVR